ncbi:L-threonylcarbamoyladenylate synthase [Frigoriglobus tundricola]|uniref:Threonylcarbamoyl-AMP synthase n=1 Tax=Frigoriglobus tundricola TaxID=2774151 RepID=A0A6M5YPP0_9BACT|nr:L-threonylcarbamoyladenylate synthase [Frigoriglobus tundricola]QJW96017.1 Threonylcarbamoyl-AMP synthase [Frigoriglobus tundricola]
MLKVDPFDPAPDVIHRAADVIRAGGLVAFPTETVYGLGANGLDAGAVARIFEAKGRPATNPVILHVYDGSRVLNVAANWPATADALAARFWPGPLTFVVPKAPPVPTVATAGGPTVAVRCPNHPVARALIRAAGVPIAAPSANRSTELSPTRAEHVLKSLNGRIDMLLDGGPCSGGIESTVVDVTGEIPRVLRPGLISVPMLEEVCGRVEIGAKDGGVSRSPGQMAKHYSPRTPVVLCRSNDEALALGTEFSRREWSWGWLSFGEVTEEAAVVPMPADPESYAAQLYRELHTFDEVDIDRILVTLPPDTPEWAAVRDRLTRAAAPG